MAKRATRKQTSTARSTRQRTAAAARSRRRKATTPRKKRAVTRKPAARSTRKRATSRKRASRTGATSRKPSAVSAAATAVRGAVAGAVAAVANRLPGAGTDALTLLITDHRRLQDLLKRGEQTTARAALERADLLKTITDELTVHELIEEKVLYPALKSHPEARDIVLEGFQEHHVADVIVDELHATSTTDERWGAKFKVFKENIEHHIEEEEGEMFRTARAVFSREQLQEMGARMAAMKADAQKA